MRIPPFLQPGDTIGVCAPARKVSREEISGGLSLLKSWGYKVLETPNLYGSCHQFSGTEQERREDLQSLVNVPRVKAIISARGGYGCLQIIDDLDWNSLNQNPKWIIGFSDITVFHSHLNRHSNLATLHAPMLFNLSGDKLFLPAANRLRDLLGGKLEEFTLPSDKSVHAFIRSGEAEGELIGGNLSLLYALSGSETDLDTEGKILFLEDLDEYLYHLDRMMMQLLRSGKIRGLKGLIVGGMSDMKDNAIPFGETAEQIIRRICDPFTFPIWFGFPAGHIPENQPIILGTTIKMSVAKTLSFHYVRTA